MTFRCRGGQGSSDDFPLVFKPLPAAKPATQAASQPQPSRAIPLFCTPNHANHHKTAMPNLQHAAHYCIYSNCCLPQFLSSTSYLPPPRFQSNCYLHCTLLSTITHSYAYQLSIRHIALARESLGSRRYCVSQPRPRYFLTSNWRGPDAVCL